ncbi:LLM class flavin-dependent oxidoreductase [Microbacterium indicum]|uniref:LLM class flavin-dependent oxidoreductase n=1 Tax=Microbacterium indicum TaxID=358100 RepID=UPI00041348D5|nr:LLM class flavin-dependent oxidoreductase [Microbacterium indicum]
MALSLGIAGSAGPDLAARLAPRLEEAGFRTLWINEGPGDDALEVAAAAARATTDLRVATGVIAIDRRPAGEILAGIARLGIPEDRLTLGIGSGRLRKGALDATRAALGELRAGTAARLAVGALGPRMRALAAEHADGIVLNWLTPAAAAAQRDELHAANPGATATLYVRTNADPAARARLESEADAYAQLPAYAANFARLGFAARDTTLSATDEIGERLARYRDAVDEVVLRAITPSGALDELLDFLPLIRG